MSSFAAERRATYREVLAVRQFRALFVAQLLSLVGDRAAAVALGVLVYERSRSPLLAATVFGLTFLPHLFAAPLSVLVDRMPRRRVLVLCDLARVPLVLLMLVPDAPLPLLFVLLGLVTLCEVPFDAARTVVMRSVLDDDQYPVGVALSSAVYEASLLIGSLGGGLLVAALSVRGCLLFDVATFVVSAVVVRLLVDEHAPVVEPDEQQSGLRQTLHFLLAPATRRMLWLALVVAGVATGAEGLSVTVAYSLGGGASLTGVLAAAIPAGTLLAGLLVPRLLTRTQQRRVALPLAGVTVGALALCALPVGVPTLVGLWALIGAGCAVLVIANPVVMAAVPDAHRGRAFGICSSVLMAAQAVGILAAGTLADHLSPTRALAVLGGLGAVALLPVALRGLAAAEGAADARREVVAG